MRVRSPRGRAMASRTNGTLDNGLSWGPRPPPSSLSSCFRDKVNKTQTGTSLCPSSPTFPPPGSCVALGRVCRGRNPAQASGRQNPRSEWGLQLGDTRLALRSEVRNPAPPPSLLQGIEDGHPRSLLTPGNPILAPCSPLLTLGAARDKLAPGAEGVWGGATETPRDKPAQPQGTEGACSPAPPSPSGGWRGCGCGQGAGTLSLGREARKEAK